MNHATSIDIDVMINLLTANTTEDIKYTAMLRWEFK